MPQLPLPVRLHDMHEVESKYLAAAPDDRLALHQSGVFTALLDDGERFALERRFPDELSGDPLAASATDGTRAAWDLRARELVVCMLQFGDKVLTARMDLVGSVAPGADVAVLGLTATGSILELGRPVEGERAFVYRASARPKGQRRDGKVRLADAVQLGNAVELGGRRTTELLAIATGQSLPPDDDFMPGTLLYGPTEDTPAPALDHIRLAVTRFRVLVDAAGNASDALRPALITRATALAQEIQGWLGGGYTLPAVRAFGVAGGTRYVVATSDKVDLVRHPPGGEAPQWIYDAYIGQQRIVLDAPLVLTHHGARQEKAVFVFRVTSIEAK